MNRQKINFQNFINPLLWQKQELIKKIPELEYYFVNIYSAELKYNIPFLPIRCFRDFDLYVPHSHEKLFRSFVSSGSTNAVRARHSFSQSRLNDYEHYASLGFKNFLIRHDILDPLIISLIPQLKEWPDSSLSAMITMFQKQGLYIEWSNPENFLTILKSIPYKKNVIIFGTTFHHLQLIHSFDTSEKNMQRKILFQNLNLSIIDTGGTKGKTQDFSLREIKTILTKFYSSDTSGATHKNLLTKKINFFSEYGMCELSSQAWSLYRNHNGTFVANETLMPFAIDLKSFEILSTKKTGFLGFIDSLNYESYPAIITEDVGYIISHKNKTFKLLGRSPDATVKGCSLNIKNFQFSNQSMHQRADHKKKKILNLKCSYIKQLKNKGNFFDDIEANLNKSYWKAWDISDLKRTLISIHHLLDSQYLDTGDKTLEHKIFNDKNVLIISAANTPISFVYPFIISALNHARTIVLKIPSIRLNDPLSKTIRAQIIDLYKYLTTFFTETKFYLSTSKSLENSFNDYDCLFVFGTDETVKIIRQRTSKNTKIFGFGDIKNAFIIDSERHTPKFLQDICSAWYGRGCLTPICLFVESSIAQSYYINFFKLLSETMAMRFALFKKVHFHAHNLLNLHARFKKIGLDTSCILHSNCVAMVDLSKYSVELIQTLDLDFSIGGCGFVLILPYAMKDYISGLSVDSIFPTIFEFSQKLTPETNQDSESM